MKSISVAGHTRAHLKRLRRQFKKAGILADLSKVSRAALSRAIAGKSHLGLKTLYKLVDLLDQKSGDLKAGHELIGAYLMDMIPENRQAHMCIAIRGEPGQAGYQCWDPFVQKMFSYPIETRFLLEQVGDAIQHRYESLPPSPVMFDCPSTSKKLLSDCYLEPKDGTNP